MVEVEAEAAHAQIQRMFLSRTFETSEAQRRLLQYLADKALAGDADRLKEYTVGIEAFSKPASYDPQEDSIVRTQTGRLRAKLREYYTTEGKNDPIVVDLPKGGFKLVFRIPEEEAVGTSRVAVEPPPEVQSHEPAAQPNRQSVGARFSPTLAFGALLLVACAGLGWFASALRDANRALRQTAEVPWPLSRVLTGQQPVVIVGEDANLPRLRLLYGKAFTLEQYQDKDFPMVFLPRASTPRESQLMELLASGAPTGRATLQNVRTIIGISPAVASRIGVRMPREVLARDVREGNHILIGSPISNPWASIFEHFLNFREVDQMVERGEKYYVNLHPQPGEELRYQGIPAAGRNGFAYATIALVPNEGRNGSVMLLSGLQSEGTEAAGLLLSLDEPRRKLHDALVKAGINPSHDWFEALIRARSVAATPGELEIVAVRHIQ